MDFTNDSKSFVFYKSFYNAIKIIPTDEEKWSVISSICEFAYEGIEPDLENASDMAKIIYYVACEQIRASIGHRTNGLKGGRPPKTKTEVKTPLLTPLLTNANANANANVNANANANTAPANANVIGSFSQTNYSNIIFKLFKDAELPCARNNEISFLQTDFTNGLSYIHNSRELHALHSEDVIQAVKNYIEVLNAPDTWVTTKMNFYSLVKSKLFYNLLPANYSLENYKRFAKEDDAKNEPREFYAEEKCPHCNEARLVWSNQRQLYECRKCGADVKNEEIGGYVIEKEAGYEY